MRERHRVFVAVLLTSAVLAGCGGSTSHRASNASSASTTVSPSSPASSPSAPSTAAPAAGPTTQRSEPPLPVALQEGGAAVVGSDLYEVAGYDVSENSTSYVFSFDGSSWHAGPSLPLRLNHPGVASIGTDLYVAGGFTPTGASSRVFVLHSGTSRWAEITPLHRARGALALVAVQDHLYAFGGRNGSVQVATPERYDPATNQWTDLPAMPDPRNHGAGYVNGADACVAGGRTPATSAAIDCFDTHASTWSRVGSLPVATSGASGALLGDRVIVGGGEPSTETHLVDVVQELRAGTWTTQPMLVPRHGTAYAIYEGRLWQCGGATSPGFHAVATCTSVG